MARGFPSMTALLGLLAIAGYQNRDKLGELLGGLGQGQAHPDQNPPGRGAAPGGSLPGGGLPGGLGGLLGGLGAGGVGGLLNGGLGELLERFKQNGHGEAAESWVGTGANKPLAPDQLKSAIGPDVLQDLAQQTGLTPEEVLARLSRDLPKAVDQYTPNGRVPAINEYPAS
jgi:uncharacterized protein YidB (DUF937 family)